MKHFCGDVCAPQELGFGEGRKKTACIGEHDNSATSPGMRKHERQSRKGTLLA